MLAVFSFEDADCTMRRWFYTKLLRRGVPVFHSGY